jgi:bacillithiol system protein YtxJ
LNWISLTNKQDFETAINEGGLFAVFKHSTRCSISSMAKSRLEREWNFGTELPIYYLDLLNFRDISSSIEAISGIQHESPQLIVFKNGKPIYSASHNGIDVSEILEKA